MEEAIEPMGKNDQRKYGDIDVEGGQEEEDTLDDEEFIKKHS